MDSYEYGEVLKHLSSKLINIEHIIKPQELSQKIQDIQKAQKNESFWSDTKKAKELEQVKKTSSKLLDKYKEAKKQLKDAQDFFALAQEASDNESLELLYDEAQSLKDYIKEAEIEVMLSDKNDSLNAIVSIHPGAGGTESQDWAMMLYRMYLRWSERMGFKAEILDYQAGDEAGIKDTSFIIKGHNAYGYIKAESGIHRLVRISPFDSNAKRHTSFSSVIVSPEVDDKIDIQIDEKDMRIDTYRASGAGGQHVNKTESAIRITHIPTNIVVQCQNDRSQHKNKSNALKMLKSRLYELEQMKKNQQKKDEPKSQIGWGHQIRSYVLAPYRQVKDNRSNKAYSNVDAILDGDINKIIEDVLISKF